MSYDLGEGVGRASIDLEISRKLQVPCLIMSFVESEEESEFECSMLGVVSVMQRRLEEESERESKVVRWWNSDPFEVAGDFTIDWFINYVGCTSEYSSQISLMELGLCETTTAEYLENRL